MPTLYAVVQSFSIILLLLLFYFISYYFIILFMYIFIIILILLYHIYYTDITFNIDNIKLLLCQYYIYIIFTYLKK